MSQGVAKTIDVLKKLSDSLSEFVAAEVVGQDGMSIASYSIEKTFNEDRAAAALSQLVSQATKAMDIIKAGKIEETITKTEKYLIIGHPIGSGKFFMQLVLKSTGNLGAARMYVAEYEKELVQTLPPSAR